MSEKEPNRPLDDKDSEKIKKIIEDADSIEDLLKELGAEETDIEVVGEEEKIDFSSLELPELYVLAEALVNLLNSKETIAAVVIQTAIIFTFLGKRNPNNYPPLQEFLNKVELFKTAYKGVARYLHEVVTEIKRRQQNP